MENIEQFQPIENSDTHISLRPTGYAFPLLSTFVERERDMNTTYGLIPNGMNESENLLRTLCESLSTVLIIRESRILS